MDIITITNLTIIKNLIKLERENYVNNNNKKPKRGKKN